MTMIICSQTCDKHGRTSGMEFGVVEMQTYLIKNPCSHLAYYVAGELRHVQKYLSSKTLWGEEINDIVNTLDLGYQIC